jgi:hypothetical protein
MAHGPREMLAHGGIRTEDEAVARRSSCSRSIRAMAAHRDRGKLERRLQSCRGTAHQSLDNGEEAARQWRSFGSKRRRRGHDRGREETN